MPTLTHLPSHRLPRERLWEHGAAALSLEELLAVLLGSGCADHDVLTLSARIASMIRLGPVTPHELAAIPGIGKAKAAVVSAALQLASMVAKYQPSSLLEPKHIYAACQDLLTLPQEHVVVFFLNVRHQPLRRELVTVGTATASLIHPREVFRPAVLHNAAAIVLAHNHPSGDPTPSQADRQATRKVAQAGIQLGIELLDHLVCGRHGFTSLKVSEPELFF